MITFSSAEQRAFWAHVVKTPTCWLFHPQSRWHGYGYFKHCSAHRYIWRARRGPIPAGGCVLHTCDVPNCVRPSHLWLGTQQDNMQDMVRKGRGHHPQGEAHSESTLTNALVRQIRRRYQRGESVTQIAVSLGRPRNSLYNIVHRRRWTHV